jgi:hypothetical protein
VHQCYRPDECDQQPHAIDRDRDTELEHGERQIDRVAAEAVRAGADDRGGGFSGGGLWPGSITVATHCDSSSDSDTPIRGLGNIGSRRPNVIGVCHDGIDRSN